MRCMHSEYTNQPESDIGKWGPESFFLHLLLLRSRDGLHYEANSLSLRRGEDEGCQGNMRSFSANVFRAFPSPRPSPSQG